MNEHDPLYAHVTIHIGQERTISIRVLPGDSARDVEARINTAMDAYRAEMERRYPDTRMTIPHGPYDS